jgi:hypothetical protein
MTRIKGEVNRNRQWTRLSGYRTKNFYRAGLRNRARWYLSLACVPAAQKNSDRGYPESRPGWYLRSFARLMAGGKSKSQGCHADVRMVPEGRCTMGIGPETEIRPTRESTEMKPREGEAEEVREEAPPVYNVNEIQNPSSPLAAARWV